MPSVACLLKFLLLQLGPLIKTLRLKVKFYSSEPNNLREELTRYQFFLQLKLDILEGRLECPPQIAVELSALALQCKIFLKHKTCVFYVNRVFKIVLIIIAVDVMVFKQVLNQYYQFLG